MKRNVLISIALLTLALFTFACATTPATPAVEGRLASIDRHSISVVPAGGQPTTVKLDWGTRVYFANGLEASGPSVLTAGQGVRVWTNGDTATKIAIQ